MQNGSGIPFFGVQRQYLQHKEELLEAIDRVLSSGQVLDGPYTNFFERKIAARCHRRHAIAVNSCTQGLIFALGASDTRNKILVPAISYVATVNSTLMAGCEPKFVDVDDRGLLDLDQIDFSLHEANIDAVMYVNLFGNMLDYDKLRTITNFFNPNHPHIPIIEDAAQSFGGYLNGVPSGKLGDISVLSFDPTKNLPNYGSGGMILTDDDDVADICYNLRDNGKRSSHSMVGTNSKMSESDCAQMLVKLKYFDEWQRRRSAIAEYYTDRISNYVDPILPAEGVTHAWHKYVIRNIGPSRSALQLALDAQGIATKIHYEHTLPEYDVSFDYYNYSKEIFRSADAHCREALSIPIYPELTDAEVERIADTIVNHHIN